MRWIKLLILLSVVTLWASNSESQTSGGGPFTNHGYTAFCDLSSGVCNYPYKVNVTTGSIYNNGNGTINITTGGGGVPGGSNPQLQYNNAGAFGGVAGSGVDSNGNVGVGSVTPGTILDVQGTIRSLNHTISGTGSLNFGNDTLATILGSQATSADIRVLTNTSVDSSTGGTLTQSGGNNIRTFSANGTFTPGFTGNVTYLCIGGGAGAGGGSNDMSGAGGAGDFVTGTMSVTNGVPVAITIGAKGTGGTSALANAGTNGGDTICGGITALGGGHGGPTNTNPPASGASGGGGSPSVTSSQRTGAAATGVHGFKGGDGVNAGGNKGAGGGGGAGGAGGDGTNSTSGAGGIGLNSSITGVSTMYSCGGNAGANSNFDGITAGSSGCACAGTGGQNAAGGNASGNGCGGGSGGITTGGASTAGGDGSAGIAIFSYVPTGSSETARFTTAGNVGIGSATPGVALDVNGTARMTGFQLRNNGAVAGYLMTSNSVGVGTWTAPANSSQWTTTNTNDVFLPNSGNVGIGTTKTTTSALTVMNGNVGIGTWVPFSVLDITGDTSGNVATYAIRFTDKQNSVNARNWLIGNNITSADNPGDLSFMVGASQNANISNSATPVLVLQKSGNIGIGSNPGTLLDIQKDAAGSDIVARIWNTDAAANSNAVFRIVATSTTGFSRFEYTDNNGYTGSIRSNTNTGFTFRTGTDSTATEAALVEAMRITTAQNIGIGTVNPVAKLSIAGNVGIGTNFNSSFVTTTPPSGGMIVEGNVGIGSVTPGQLLDVKGIARILGTGSDFQVVNGNIGIGTTLTTTASMSVMNGNVGIGTWVPAYSLDIKGGNLGIGTATPFQVSSVGNVGIGTVTPKFTNPLTIGAAGQTSFNNIGYVGFSRAAGGVGSYPITISASTALGYIVGYDGGTSTYFIIGGSGQVSGATDTSVAFGAINDPIYVCGNNSAGGCLGAYVNSTAGVGIPGGTNPGAQFEVRPYTAAEKGQIIRAASNQTADLQDWNQSNGQTLTSIGSSGGLGLGIGYLPSYGNLAVINNIGIGTWSGMNGSLIVATGNVGIGSASPGQALDVVGTVRALSGGTCTTLYQCQGGVDAGVIQTSACVLCPASTCVAMNLCG